MQWTSRSRWMVLLLIMTSLLLVACAQTPAGSAKTEPVQVEPPGAAGVRRVVVTEKAAERLGIRTAPVREEQIVQTRTVGGEVVGVPAGSPLGAPAPIAGAASAPGAASVGVPNPSRVLVRVRLTEGDLEQVDRSRPARVLPLERQAGSAGGVTVRPIEAPVAGDLEGGAAALYYALDGTAHGLAPAQRVLVELAFGDGGVRKIVPYSAVLYDLEGEAWVYVSPQPRAFVRQRIIVDYIDGELAVLQEGPPAGTAIVTVAAAELYGAESGIGKK